VPGDKTHVCTKGCFLSLAVQLLICESVEKIAMRQCLDPKAVA